jgi:hypothetical protein
MINEVHEWTSESKVTKQRFGNEEKKEVFLVDET